MVNLLIHHKPTFDNWKSSSIDLEGLQSCFNYQYPTDSLYVFKQE